MSVGNKITKAQRWAHAVCQRSKFCLRYLLNTAPQLPVYAVVDEDGYKVALNDDNIMVSWGF
jgi:hypothetical protein